MLMPSNQSAMLPSFSIGQKAEILSSRPILTPEYHKERACFYTLKTYLKSVSKVSVDQAKERI